MAANKTIIRDSSGKVIPSAVAGERMPVTPPTAKGSPVTVDPRPTGDNVNPLPGGYAPGWGPEDHTPSTRGGQGPTLTGGPERSANGGLATSAIAQQTAQQNVTGATPFMQTPGMQIASQRISGQDIQNDPAISAALADFNNRIAPGIQNRATTSGLGRSSAALDALTQAQASMLAPMYQEGFGREQTRLNNMNTAAENELGRGERSASRVADANQNMAQMLMQLSGQQYNQQQQAGQNLMGAGGTFRDIAQQGNSAEMNDFLRRQALGEQAVGMPFGAAAGSSIGSTTSSTGK